MIVFHGTNKNSALKIVDSCGGVDVSLGGGELGRGFYLCEDPFVVATWACGRFNLEYAVVKFEIEDTECIRLKTKILKQQAEVIALWKSLKLDGTTKSYVFNVDVVRAPFATLDSSIQYKFESISAQDAINNCSRQILHG